MMGFKQREGFTADQGAQNAPNVDFSDQQRQPQVNFNDTLTR